LALRFQPPNPFPPVSLPDLEGTERPFVTAWAERPAIFLIGHRDCVTTRMTLPFVDRIHRRRPANASVIAILQDESGSARELRHDLELALPVLVEADPFPVAAELGLRSVPTVFLVGTDGKIVKTSEGFRRDDLEAMAEAVGMAGPLFTEADAGVPARRPG
jgi:peroxiredoxin